MIPIRLRISGFLSYHDPVELDFTRFDLACISGQNGAGKSSLLDAITWALFGQARRRDDALVNLQSKAAEVTLIFQYEGAIYRIQRALPRGKAGILEFQRLETEKTPAVAVAAPDGEAAQSEYRLPEHPSWRPLTERTVRETQLCIEETLRLDYDTFVNAAFFLQGKADQFTQQTASKRKDVLGSILGLEVWEQYKARASDKRKRFEDDLALLERRIVEIDTELGEDQARKQRLAELETDLKQLSLARKSQAAALESIKHTAASLAQQRKLVAALAASVHRSRVQLDTLCSRLAERQSILSADAELIGRAAEIQASYHLWRQTVAELEEWDKVAIAFREHDKERAPLLQKIAGEKARLEEEQRSLTFREQEVKNQQATIGGLQSQIEAAEELLLILEAKVSERAALEERRAAARETQVRLQAENEALRPEMAALRQRIDTLESAEGAACPLCGQPLSPEHRESTLQQLRGQGTEKGDRFRANKVLMDETSALQREVQSGLDGLSTAEVERLACSNSLAQLRERIQSLQNAAVEWGSQGKKRLKELAQILKDEKYALDAQKELARVNKYLAGLGYEAAAHDATRTAEQAQRPADEEYRKLEFSAGCPRPVGERDRESQVRSRQPRGRDRDPGSRISDRADRASSWPKARRQTWTPPSVRCMS